MKVFTEARSYQMLVNHGPDMKFVPVTFGFRW